MAHNVYTYPNNNVDLSPDSTVHIALSLGGPPRVVPPVPTPGFPSVLPIRTADQAMPLEVPASHEGSSCGTMETMEEEQGSRGQAAVPVKQEAQDFAFEWPPYVTQMQNPPLKTEASTKAGLSEVMYTSCGRFPAPSRAIRRRHEYDAATMADFRQHLNVIDCRGALLEPWSRPHSYEPASPIQPYRLANHALQDYQMQLMLLEQQNRKRELMRKQDRAE
jgi:hypothetical protein